MKKRIITGLIMAAILIPLVLVPQCLPVLEFVIVLFAIIGEIELLNMYDKEKKLHFGFKILAIVLMLALSFSIFSYMHEKIGFESGSTSVIVVSLAKLKLTDLFTPAVTIIAIFIILMGTMIFVHDFTVADVGRLFISIIYIGACSAAILTLRFFGIRFLVYILVVCVLTDIFALVFGLTLGKHKMAPYISPKKSWEGAIGGTCVAVVVGFSMSYFYPQICQIFPAAGGDKVIEFYDGVFKYSTFTPVGKVFACLVITLLLSISSQIGDLVASKLKRAYGIKDYSNIFPGHGGILDRFDSVFFASAMFLVIILLEYNFFL